MDAPPPNDRVLRPLRWVAIVVLILGVLGFLVKGADTTRRPSLAAGPSRVSGFPQIAFSLRSAAGATRRFCGLLAVTVAQQDQGLMNRTNLAGYDAMVFQFAQPTTIEFYMKDTVIALSIAWFDANGRFVSSTDMTPCPPTHLDCPLYGAARAYTDAVEVPAGGLRRLGVGTGSVLTVGGSC